MKQDTSGTLAPAGGMKQDTSGTLAPAGGAMAEEGLTPIKQALLQNLIPAGADKLNGDISKKERGFVPPPPNLVPTNQPL